jgi:hypothetical protein
MRVSLQGQEFPVEGLSHRRVATPPSEVANIKYIIHKKHAWSVWRRFVVGNVVEHPVNVFCPFESQE